MTYKAPSKSNSFSKVTALLLLFSVLLLMPRQAKAGVADIISYLQTITNTLQKEIGQTLSQMERVQAEIAATHQQVVWPTTAITQAQSLALSMRTRYQPSLQAITQLPVASASLPTPSTLEAAIRSGIVRDLRPADQLYSNVFSHPPAATDAPPFERNVIDMDDAFALASIKQASASDQNSAQLIQLANALELRTAAAAPGSSIYLNVEAQIASLHNQAQNLKIIAAQLRVEAGTLAHDNTMLKKRALNARQLRMDLQNIFTRAK